MRREVGGCAVVGKGFESRIWMQAVETGAFCLLRRAAGVQLRGRGRTSGRVKVQLLASCRWHPARCLRAPEDQRIHVLCPARLLLSPQDW